MELSVSKLLASEGSRVPVSERESSDLTSWVTVQSSSAMFLRNVMRQLPDKLMQARVSCFVEPPLLRGQRLERVFQFQLQQNVFNFKKIPEHLFKQSCSPDWFLHRGTSLQKVILPSIGSDHFEWGITARNISCTWTYRSRSKRTSRSNLPRAQYVPISPPPNVNNAPLAGSGIGENPGYIGGEMMLQPFPEDMEHCAVPLPLALCGRRKRVHLGRHS